jgi:hypothetical protein
MNDSQFPSEKSNKRTKESAIIHGVSWIFEDFIGIESREINTMF